MTLKPILAAAAALALAATPAAAYVGPGAGLSLLGALWGLVAAVAVTLGFIVLWPLRRLFRSKKPAPARIEQPGQAPATAERHEPRNEIPS